MTDFLNMRTTVTPIADRAPEVMRDVVTGTGGDAVYSARRLARELDSLAGELVRAVAAVRGGRRVEAGTLSGHRLGGLVEVATEYDTLRARWEAVLDALPETEEGGT